MCYLCNQSIDRQIEDVLVRPCGHECHVQCFLDLREYKLDHCSKCNTTVAVTYNDAKQVSGYTLDTGTNPNTRSRTMEALEHYFTQVKERDASANLNVKSFSSSSFSSSRNTSLPSSIKPSYGTVPYASTLQKTWLQKINVFNIDKKGHTWCLGDVCGGPSLCLHVYDQSKDNPIFTRVISDWISYDLPCPVSPNSILHMQKKLQVLFKLHASPKDLYRCGVTPCILALAGVTIIDMICYLHYPLQDVIEGLQLTFSDMHLLQFHISLLKLRNLFPLFMLAKIGMTIKHVLEYCITYHDLVNKLDITQEELLVLGANATILIQLGITSQDVTDAIASLPEQRNVYWYMRSFNWTNELLQSVGISDKNYHVSYQ